MKNAWFQIPTHRIQFFIFSYLFTESAHSPLVWVLIFFPIFFSHCVFDQWTKANELNRYVYLFTRDSRLNIRYDNAYIQIFSIIVRYEHNSLNTVRTCSTWATLRPKMFGVGDFWLKTTIIIKIESHPFSLTYPRFETTRLSCFQSRQMFHEIHETGQH